MHEKRDMLSTVQIWMQGMRMGVQPWIVLLKRASSRRWLSCYNMVLRSILSMSHSPPVFARALETVIAVYRQVCVGSGWPSVMMLMSLLAAWLVQQASQQV